MAAGTRNMRTHGQDGHGNETATGRGRRHGVGLSDAQRAVLTELIEAAPLPPPEVITRLRGYLPPTTCE